MKKTGKTQALQKQVEEYISTSGLSQRNAARELGVSDSQLSQWRRDRYTNGDIKGLEAKIGRWLAEAESLAAMGASLPTDPEWVPTPTALEINDTLEFAHLLSMQVIIYGSAGMSKTATCRYFKTNHTNVWLLTPTGITSTKKGVLSLLCDALHLSKGKALADLQFDCIEKMTNSRGLIIIDEAQQLPPASMDLMRQVAEMAGVGLAYVGNDGVYTQMMAGQQAGKFAQIYSRNMQKKHLTLPDYEDVETLTKAMGITDKHIIRFLFDISQSPGALRYVTKTIQLATMTAAGGKVVAALVEEAFRSLTGLKLRVGGARS